MAPPDTRPMDFWPDAAQQTVAIIEDVHANQAGLLEQVSPDLCTGQACGHLAVKSALEIPEEYMEDGALLAMLRQGAGSHDWPQFVHYSSLAVELHLPAGDCEKSGLLHMLMQQRSASLLLAADRGGTIRPEEQRGSDEYTITRNPLGPFPGGYHTYQILHTSERYKRMPPSSILSVSADTDTSRAEYAMTLPYSVMGEIASRVGEWAAQIRPGN